MKSTVTTGILFCLLLVPPVFLHARKPSQIVFGELRTTDSGLDVSIGGCNITIAPYSSLRMCGDIASTKVSTLELIEGHAWITEGPSGASDSCVFSAGGADFTPSLSPLHIWTSATSSPLAPKRPVFIYPKGPGAMITGPGKAARRPLKSGKRCLVFEDAFFHVTALKYPGFDETAPEAPAVKLDFFGPDDQAGTVLSARGQYIESKLFQTDRIKVPIGSDDFYTSYSFHFTPAEVSFSLDGESLGERSVTIAFRPAANIFSTGSAACVRFVTNDGYIVLLAPRSRISVSASDRPVSGSACIELAKGAAVVIPPPDKSTGLPNSHTPGLALQRIAGFTEKYGTCLFMAGSPEHGRFFPLLMKLHIRPSIEPEIFKSIGKARCDWLNCGVSSPVTLKTAQSVRAGDNSTGAAILTRPQALARLARAAELNIPVFSPLPRFPLQVSDFLNSMAVHLDDTGTDNLVYVSATAAPDTTKPADLRKFAPRRGANKLLIYSKHKRVTELDFFRPRLPGKKKDDKRFSSREALIYIFRDRGMDISSPKKILKKENMDEYTRLKTWLKKQLKQRPYRTACAVVFLLALSVYVLAKGPVKVLTNLWRLLTFFRGEPCHRCGMPLEKFHIPRFPIDAHLAVATRLIMFGGSLSPQEMVQGIPDTLDLTKDLDEEHVERCRFTVEGESVWCLRCSKGQIRFRLYEHGELAEESKHPILLPHYIEFVRRWHDKFGG